MPKIISLHDVLEPFKKALLASRDVIISSQICGSNLQKVFTLGDGCWLPTLVRNSGVGGGGQNWILSLQTHTVKGVKGAGSLGGSPAEVLHVLVGSYCLLVATSRWSVAVGAHGLVAGLTTNIFFHMGRQALSLAALRLRSVQTTPDPNTSEKVSRYKWEAYRDTNWWCIYYFLPRGGHTFAKVCHRNGRCIAILFKSIGVRGCFDSPDLRFRVT